MGSILSSGWLEAFVVLFVAIDIPGLVPFYLATVAEMAVRDQARVLRQAVFGAAVIGSGFFLAGNFVLGLLDVTLADFQVAGGLLLVALSLQDLIFGPIPRKGAASLVGVVPLAIPMIVGPAVMTVSISLIQSERIGTLKTVVAFLVNLALLWLAARVALRFGRRATGVLMAASKVISILLAAIGVNMARRGLEELGIIGRRP